MMTTKQKNNEVKKKKKTTLKSQKAISQNERRVKYGTTKLKKTHGIYGEIDRVRKFLPHYTI